MKLGVVSTSSLNENPVGGMRIEENTKKVLVEVLGGGGYWDTVLGGGALWGGY